MTLEQRIQIEKDVATKIVDDALALGYSISLNNGGEEDELTDCRDREKILAELKASDEDTLKFTSIAGNHLGWVWLVYGNSGWDVIRDYTTNLEELLKGAFDLCTELEEKYS